MKLKTYSLAEVERYKDRVFRRHQQEYSEGVARAFADGFEAGEKAAKAKIIEALGLPPNDRQ